MPIPTLRQLSLSPRLSPKKRKKTFQQPHIKAVCIRLLTAKPKKPNSALRKIALVKTYNKKTLYTFIPGIGHNLQEHHLILIQGGGPQDLPGIRTSAIRGVLDLHPVLNRISSPSKYGVKTSHK